MTIGEIAVAIVTAMIYVIIAIAVSVVIYKILKLIFGGSMRYWFKYGFFRRKYRADYVQLCEEFIEKEMNFIEIKKFLLIELQHKKTVEEILYIYNKLLKQMKGGQNGRQYKQNNGEVKKTPSIFKKRN